MIEAGTRLTWVGVFIIRICNIKSTKLDQNLKSTLGVSVTSFS